MVSYIAMDQVAHDREAKRAMRVGILTLHSQTNYGGVLQAYALQETIRRLGHEVFVIDRWFDDRNAMLKGIVASRSVVAWMKFLTRALLGFGDFADYIRHVRTSQMLPRILNLTPFSFSHWKDAPCELGLDVIIVGSDQVWNPAIQGKELPYLLEGAPEVPAIAYAASFGTPELPECLQARYREGMKRFKAISVRENEAVRIVESLGAFAEHVVDPTLLADSAIWKRFVVPTRLGMKHKLFCYFINYPLGFVVSELRKFTKIEGCDAEVFFGGPCALLPSSFLDFLRISSGNIRAMLSPGVHVRMTATPDEFVDALASSDMVLTDSFHALMFSTIFRKNVRVLSPKDGRGTAGFARLREFCDSFLDGCVICNDMATALRSFHRGEYFLSYNDKALSTKVASSRRWIHDKISEECLFRRHK